MKTKRNSRQPTRVSEAQLEKEVQEFDREFVADTFGPPSRQTKALWERAKRKPGRPRKGQGIKVISVSVEKDLLRRSDALAKQMGITRADLVDRGLHAVLAAVGKDAG